VQRRCGATAHPTNDYDYAGPLLQYLLPPALPRASAVTTVDEQALDRILAAVGKKFVPAELNGNALWSAIKEADETKNIVDRFRSGPRTRAIRKSMKSIAKAADALARAIKENEDSTQLIDQNVPLVPKSIQQLIDFSAYLEQKLGKSNAYLRAKYDRIPSATDWLGGVELPNVFEEFFDRKAGRSQSDDGPSGPTVRFIVAAMNEIGRSPSPETIVRAMTRYSELRKLRRSLRQQERAKLRAKVT
jgi:hypothetical protein